MKNTMKWLICLFKGHSKWHFEEATLDWDLFAITDPSHGSDVKINVCKRCGKMYTEWF